MGQGTIDQSTKAQYKPNSNFRTLSAMVKCEVLLTLVVHVRILIVMSVFVFFVLHSVAVLVELRVELRVVRVQLQRLVRLNFEDHG